MYSALVLLLAAVATAAMLFFLRSKKMTQFDRVLKVLVVIFCVLGFSRLFLSDAIVFEINGGWYEGIRYEDADVWHVILRWGYFLNYAVLPMAVFYESRFFRNIAAVVCLPFSILSAVFFNDYMEYFLSELGRGYHLPAPARYVLFVIELVLAISVPLTLLIKKKHVPNVKSGKEMTELLLGIPATLFAAMPLYAPQAFLGYNNREPAIGSNYHLTWIAFLFVLCVSMYYIFRFKNYDTRYRLCVFITILGLFQFNSIYLMGVTIRRLPFQLCNIATYFYFIAMVFKLKKMFQFCFIANMTGAIFAIIVADLGYGNFSFFTMEYVIEHTYVLLIPAMVMGLRILPRVDTKSLKYVFGGFTLYFLFAFVLGTVLNGFSDVTGEKVNYFFMFDLELAYDFFPFMTFTSNWHYTLGRFEFYPVVVVLIYLLYSLLCFLIYLLVRFAYKLEDDHLELRRSSIELRERITGRPSWRKKYFVE